MNDTELQLKQIKEFGVLKWNIAEDITNIQEQNNERDEKKSILEEIFPPREWTNTNDELGTKIWRQTISRELLSDDNIIQMLQTFEDCERFLKFKDNEICRSRNALSNLFFDELLRQIIIENEELGKIIYRIHKEFKNWILTLKYLVERGAVFDLEVESMTEDPEVKDLVMINKDLTTKCEKASQKYLESLRQKELNGNIEYLKWLESRHKDQIFIIEKSNEKLKDQLNEILAPGKFAPFS